MAFYWRLKDMPELSAMPRKVRGEWWREATVGSLTTGDRWGRAAALVALVLAGIESARHWHWNGFEVLVAVAVAGIVGTTLEMLFQQRRARQWLREHLPKDTGTN